MLQPLLVRPIADATARCSNSSPASGAGARRSARAARGAGAWSAPLADRDALEIALVENLQREDLSPLEEAEAYSRLMREFGRTQASLAEAVGKSRSHVANTLRLLALPAPVRQSLEDGALSAGHARALLGAPDPATLAREVIGRGLNVRATEALVRRRAATPKPAPGRGAMPTPRRWNASWRRHSGCASCSRRTSAAAA